MLAYENNRAVISSDGILLTLFTMIKTGLHIEPKVCMVDGPAVFVAFLENIKTQQP